MPTSTQILFKYTSFLCIVCTLFTTFANRNIVVYFLWISSLSVNTCEHSISWLYSCPYWYAWKRMRLRTTVLVCNPPVPALVWCTFLVLCMVAYRILSTPLAYLKFVLLASCLWYRSFCKYLLTSLICHLFVWYSKLSVLCVYLTQLYGEVLTGIYHYLVASALSGKPTWLLYLTLRVSFLRLV